MIKYCNSSEQKLSLTKGDAQDSTYPMCTDRAVRRLIKIFSVEDGSLAEDLAEIAKKYEPFKQAEDSLEDGDDITAQVVEKPRPGGRRAGPKPQDCVTKKTQQGECCCQEHCNLTVHYRGNVKMELFEKLQRCMTLR